jgi:hypothetical protein
MNKADLNPLDSLHTVMATDVRDWASNRNDAWLYGIVCGWDKAALKELRAKHGWSRKATKRLKYLHKKLWAIREGT